MNRIPMLNLRAEYELMKQDIDGAITNCLDHQRWILGPEVKELESKVKSHLGANHCLGVSSGTDGLVLALRSLAIKLKGREYFDKSDKIITTPFTFTATGDAILRSGATPLYVDIDPNTYNIDPEKIRECLNSNRYSNVIGIMPVHLYGQSCDMDSIMKVAKENNLFVVEDVAQAFGGKWKGKALGTIGDMGAFSFFPSKNLGGFGDGGMIATNNDQLMEIAEMLRKHGGKDKYNVKHVGYNARLDTLQAAIILAKMNYIEDFNTKRSQAAKVYNEELRDVSGVILPQTTTETENDHVYHQYTLRVQNNNRDKLGAYLKEEGIDTMIYYPVPLHKMAVFENRSESAGSFTETERVAKEVLSLPISPLITKDEQLRVCEVIKKGVSEII